MILNALILAMFLAQAQAPAKEPAKEPAAQAEPPVPIEKSDAEAAREEAKKKDAEAKAIIAEFKKGLKNCKDAATLGSAIKSLGETQHPRIMAELRNWLGNPNVEVVGAAVEQLVKYKNEKSVAEGLLQAAKQKKDKEGVAKCLAGVGDIGYRPVAPGLLDFLHNKDVSVCKTALESCGKLKSKYTVDRLIGLARDLDGIRTDIGAAGGYGVPATGPTLPWVGIGGASAQQTDDITRKNTLLPVTYDALKKITGQNWATVKEWDVWWRQNKGTFKELE